MKQVESREMTSREWIYWRKRVEVVEEVEFWGSKYKTKPRLVPTVFGDGEAWVAFIPLNTRPNYYVVKMDSNFRMADGDAHDVAEDVMCAIEEEYGNVDDDGAEREWPELNLDCGWVCESYSPPPAKRSKREKRRRRRWD